MLSSDSTAKKRGLNRETISFLFRRFLSYYMLRVRRWQNNPCASQRVKNRKGRSLDSTERTLVRATLIRLAARNRCWKMRRLVKPEQIHRHARTSVALNGRSDSFEPRGLQKAPDQTKIQTRIDTNVLFLNRSNIFIRLFYTQRDRCVIVYRRDFDYLQKYETLRSSSARPTAERSSDELLFLLYLFFLVIIYYQRGIQYRYTLSLFVRTRLVCIYLYIYTYPCTYV